MAKKRNGVQSRTDEIISQVEVLQIFCDPKWNSRSGDWKKDEQYALLLQSIKSEGIKTPLDLRPTPEKYSTQTDKPFMLVSGFRRFCGAEDLRLLKIPCIVSDMTEAAARLRNIQENVRDDLRTQDQCWALGQLDGKATQQEIATSCGLAQSYVCKLLKIYKGLNSHIFEVWRTQTAIKIPIAEIISLAGLPKDKQDDQFLKLVQACSVEKGKRGKGAWIEGALRRAADFGYKFAYLVEAGLIGNFEENSAFWEQKDIAIILRCPSSATLEQSNLLANSLIENYHQAKTKFSKNIPTENTDNETEQFTI